MGISVGTGHHLESLEGLLFKLITMFWVRDSDKLIGSSSERLAEQIGNSELSDHKVHVCPGCHDTCPCGDGREGGKRIRLGRSWEWEEIGGWKEMGR